MSMSWTSKVVVSYIGPPPSAQIIPAGGALLVEEVEGIALLRVIFGLLMDESGCLEEGLVLIGNVDNGFVAPMDVLTS